MTVWYVVEGVNPEPWEMPMLGIGKNRKSGKMYTTATKTENLRAYQEALAEEFMANFPWAEPMDEIVSVKFLFWRQIEKGLVGGKKRQSNIVDATNLQKSTEDALQGILYKNDRGNQFVSSLIVAQDENTSPRVAIGVSTEMPRVDWSEMKVVQPVDSAQRTFDFWGDDPDEEVPFALWGKR